MGAPALFRNNPKMQYEMSMIYEGLSPETFDDSYSSGISNSQQALGNLVEKDHMDKVD